MEYKKKGIETKKMKNSPKYEPPKNSLCIYIVNCLAMFTAIVNQWQMGDSWEGSQFTVNTNFFFRNNAFIQFSATLIKVFLPL